MLHPHKGRVDNHIMKSIQEYLWTREEIHNGFLGEKADKVYL